MTTTAQSRKKREGVEIAIPDARYEAKYVIPPETVPDIRAFIEPFCQLDPNCIGSPPSYVVNTLQLDSPDLTLHRAKQDERDVRFKLRVRTYGRGDAPWAFLEVKRKFGQSVSKRRSRIPIEKWCKELVLAPHRKLDVEFRSESEELSFLEFVRLAREIGARPVVTLSYTRESYMGVMDEYTRVTFDRNLLYRPTESWDLVDPKARWLQMDGSLAQNQSLPYSGVVLELKTLRTVPQWMEDLVAEFDLVRVGHCKYSNAVWMESLFRGSPGAPAYVADLLLF